VVWVLEFGKPEDSNLNAKTYLMIIAGTKVGLMIDGLHMTNTGFQFQSLFLSLHIARIRFKFHILYI